MKFKAIALHEDDNAAVVLDDVRDGENVAVGGRLSLEIKAREAIKFGHKIALVDIAEGEKIKKYGRPIGVALKDIGAGEHVHVHNVGGLRVGAAKSERKEGRS